MKVGVVDVSDICLCCDNAHPASAAHKNKLLRTIPRNCENAFYVYFRLHYNSFYKIIWFSKSVPCILQTKEQF